MTPIVLGIGAMVDFDEQWMTACGRKGENVRFMNEPFSSGVLGRVFIKRLDNLESGMSASNITIPIFTCHRGEFRSKYVLKSLGISFRIFIRPSS